jgi:hypothetical protein
MIDIAKKLRQGHHRVTQHLVKGSEQALLANSLVIGQAQGASALIVVGAPGMDQDHVAFFERLGSQDLSRRNGRVKRPIMKKITLSALMAHVGPGRRRKESS